MANFLDKMPGVMAKAFKGKLRVGTIRKKTYSSDAYNDRVETGHTDYTFTGIRDSFDARYRAQALIPERDVKILVLLGSTKVQPERADDIFIDNAWFRVREIIEMDPATASATCQAFQIVGP